MKRFSKLWGGVIGMGLANVIGGIVRLVKPNTSPATIDAIVQVATIILPLVGVYTAPPNTP